MKALSKWIMWPVVAAIVLSAAGCIVEPPHDDVWCANHPYKCGR